MVRTSTLQIGSILSVLFHLTAARVAPASLPTITPFPQSPWAPGSPFADMVQRDDKDNNKPQTSLASADFGKFCGLVSTALTDSHKSCSGDDCKVGVCSSGDSCQFDKKDKFMNCGKSGSDVKKACVGDADMNNPGLYPNIDTNDQSTMFCTSPSDNNKRKLRRDGNDNNDYKSACITYTQDGPDAYTMFACAASSADATAPFDTTMAVTVTASSSSQTSTNTNTSTSTTATATSATATPSASNAPAADTNGGLPTWGIVLAVIGSVLGAIAVVLLAYHFLSSKLHPEDADGAEQPLVEGKQWKGPWQGRGGE